MVCKYRTNVLIRSYGYAERLTNKKIIYKRVNLPSLTNSALNRKKLHCPYIADNENDQKICLFYEHPNISSSQKILGWTGMLATPSWHSATETGFSFNIFIPQKNTAQSTYFDIDDMLRQIIQDGKSCEIIHDRLHITTLILDIDIIPFYSVSIDRNQLYEDLIELIEYALKEIPDIEHYLFSSKGDGKIGIHHHIVFPNNVACTHQFAQELIMALNELRYIFPNTVGVYCGDRAVFDTNIYKINNEKVQYQTNDGEIDIQIPKLNFHGLRCPFQVKYDNSRQLLLVKYKSKIKHDGVPPLRTMFAHASNCVGDEYGKVYYSYSGVKSISDMGYYSKLQRERIDNYANSFCENNITAICKAINKKIIMFDEWEIDFPSIAEKEFLLRSLNEIWENSGKSLMRRMLNKTVGDFNTRYHQGEIQKALSQSRLIIRDNKIVLSSRPSATTFDLCPVRVHKKKHANGVVIQIIYKTSMIRFGLQIISFKEKCRNIFLDEVYLLFKDMLVSTRIRQYFSSCINVYNKPTTILMTLHGKATDVQTTYMTPYDTQRPLSTILVDIDHVNYVYVLLKNMTLFQIVSKGYVFVFDNLAIVSRDIELFFYCRDIVDNISKELLEQIRSLLENNK